MIHPIINDIVKNKKPVFFVSPHFDDAILSAGALMSYLAGKTVVTVINLFTKSEGSSTLSAKAFLKQCGYTDAKTLFADREKEDAAVLEQVSDMVINLGHTDALWRKKPNGDIVSSLLPFIPETQVLYPTYRFHISKGNIASKDKALITKIKQELQTLVTKDAVIFCPFGIGNHVDHVITRRICEEQFASSIYWSDFPYNQQEVREKTTGFEKFSFTDNLAQKEQLAKGYKTQYNAMFPNGFPKEPEVFFTK